MLARSFFVSRRPWRARRIVQEAAGHPIHPGPRRNDEQAALGRQKLSVLFAGALREDEQGLTVFAGLNGLLDGSHLILCAAHAHRAAAPEEPCQEAVDLEQFLLGKYDHPPAPPGDHDEHRVDGGDMGGRKDAAFGLHLFQVLAALYADTETDVPQDPCKGY